MYPFQEFVLSKMKEHNISRVDLVKKTGYKNITKGLRCFDEFMKYNVFNVFIAANIHKALHVTVKDVVAKLQETDDIIKAEIERKNRENFVPFLYVETELKVPSPIFICAMTGADRLKSINLGKDFNEHDETRQMKIIRASIQESLNRHEGSIPTFRKITSFLLCRYYDEPQGDRTVFDLQGNPVPDASYESKRIHLGTAAIWVKGKDASKFFQSMLNADNRSYS